MLPEVLEAEMTQGHWAEGANLDGSQQISFWLSQAKLDYAGGALAGVPRDRIGQFSTALFGPYQRSARAFVAALVEDARKGGRCVRQAIRVDYIRDWPIASTICSGVSP